MIPQLSFSRERVELAYPGKPDTTTRTVLKRRGFAWDPVAKVWHLANPVNLRFVRSEPVTVDGVREAIEWVRDTYMIPWPVAAAVLRAEHDQRHIIGARSMESALGI